MEYNLVCMMTALSVSEEKITSVITIQKWYRGCITRLKRLPTIMYVIKSHLSKCYISFSTASDDGRINSSLDEKVIIEQLSILLTNRVIIPRIRMWYDIVVYDYMYGWLPVNIKTTRTTTSDNTGNIAMCVYAYTDEKLEIDNTIYTNGYMSNILFTKLKNKKYNTNNKKDYYFIVLNKINNSIIVNSVKGLEVLTPNINNLPFQVMWSRNTTFKYGNIKKKVYMFIKCLQKPKPGWKETFMQNMRSIDLKTR